MIEYRWLKNHVKNSGYILSYPEKASAEIILDAIAMFTFDTETGTYMPFREAKELAAKLDWRDAMAIVLDLADQRKLEESGVLAFLDALDKLEDA